MRATATMAPELGNFALILGLCMSLVLSTLPLIGSLNNTPGWVALAKPAAWGQFFFVSISFAVLVNAFLTNDFSVLYVAQHGNTQLPTDVQDLRRVGCARGIAAAVGADPEQLDRGRVPVQPRPAGRKYVARVLAVMGMVSIGFLSFLLFTSNPFDRVFPVPLEGGDLNPLLQDFGLAVHPPMLYMGYVGLSVAFSFALAALIGGKLDAAWARWSRPWTLIAWVFLTIGITLGSWWAYYELGWGGWWFWDPVENASFMPWLVATALDPFPGGDRENAAPSSAGRYCWHCWPSRSACSAPSWCAPVYSPRCTRLPLTRHVACSSWCSCVS